MFLKTKSGSSSNRLPNSVFLSESSQIRLSEYSRLFQTGRNAKTLTFREFIEKVAPRYEFYAHNELLIEQLQKVADGEIKRFMAFMPPRHFKSETVSRLFTAYWLYRFPEQWVALASYGADLAEGMSRDARDRYIDGGGKVRQGSAAVNRWRTTRGGGMWAVGVRGSATGKGWNLGVIDDPVKDDQEAQSPTIRERTKAWYQSTWLTRQAPDAAMVIIQTRWHLDDLSGWLLAEGESGQHPEGWTILSLPAIAEEEATAFPETCTVILDWREEGDALCPEWYPLEVLDARREQVGSYVWGALYQQRPSPLEGGIIKRQWWRYWQPKGANLPPVVIKLANGEVFETYPVDLPDDFEEMLQSWDCAFKDATSSDYVAGQVWGRKRANKYLLDYKVQHADVIKTVGAIKAWSIEWPRAAAKLIEDKANGPAVIQLLRDEVSGLIAVNPEGGKISRVYAISPEIESGNVFLPHPRLYPWVSGFVNNCASFPNGAHDDDVDAMSQGLVRMRVMGVESAPSIWG